MEFFDSTYTDVVRINPCGHFFHHTCVLRWLEEARRHRLNSTCPNCRATVFIPPDVEQDNYADDQDEYADDHEDYEDVNPVNPRVPAAAEMAEMI
jgi:hypothetical protein